MNAPPEELVRGVALLRQGDLAGARRAAEMALRKQPRHPGVLQLLGVICCQSGETAKGAELLRESLRLDPSTTLHDIRWGRKYGEISSGSLRSLVQPRPRTL